MKTITTKITEKDFAFLEELIRDDVYDSIESALNGIISDGIEMERFARASRKASSLSTDPGGGVHRADDFDEEIPF